MHLDAPAATWYQGLAAENLLPDWDAFTRAIRHRFDPSEYEDATALLAKLSQTGSVLDYQATFENLSSKATCAYPPLHQTNLQRDVDADVPLSVQTLLAEYDNLFAEPTGLPPARDVDQRIPLKTGIEAINVRPYPRIWPFILIISNKYLPLPPPSPAIKHSKCSFATPTVEFLGHIVSAHGVSADPAKLEAVRGWPLPTTPKQVRGFLGLTSYYRHFIRHYTTLATPLTDLLTKDGFTWCAQAEHAFNSLKEALSYASVLALPDFSIPFVVETDASGVGIGAGTKLHFSFAYHPQSDGQTEHVNRCIEQFLRSFVHDQPSKWSKILSWAECHYNTTFQASTSMTPFEVTFSRKPPSLMAYCAGTSAVKAVDHDLRSQFVLESDPAFGTTHPGPETYVPRPRHYRHIQHPSPEGLAEHNDEAQVWTPFTYVGYDMAEEMSTYCKRLSSILALDFSCLLSSEYLDKITFSVEKLAADPILTKTKPLRDGDCIRRVPKTKPLRDGDCIRRVPKTKPLRDGDYSM
ncbi:hypothetical protein NL676_022880 [Syzygium grande]|nr:hypothetical protein NL676_022880 [Syzygium grande]